ncbi:Gfo/Idh/MocA family protein [Puniceibacterium sp. IMCC21224]|uniref:Gfo/Idh/MocA family protein n=1 Tax=Puniceibacterium sp. IMCC21224 TaxID=1618204 RepID=UPI00064DA8C1|nr:Gfo/Idh/MocA family oxidoreductase [Puniceibacterium sp. IMCC21224]KMK64997.1 putative dehydrogenase [Puniceibacterium sp. IMCC21224]
MTATKIAIIGVGKIARDQHVPALADDARFDLAATVSSSGGLVGIENFGSIAALLAARPDIPALSLCMPPVPRFAAAQAAISAGRHVMLEKPPGASVAEVLRLRTMADAAGVTLFATWHSRYATGVAAARAWLAQNPPRRVRIDWKEDVRKWHPGQGWIWEPGGLGVFDPGINALSILTEILPTPVHLTAATLSFPENRATPIAAELAFTGADSLTVTADFDWRHGRKELWQIEVETNAGILCLSNGGATLTIDGRDQVVTGPGEYPALYDRFAGLLESDASDVDAEPLIHVADAFMLGRRVVVDPFPD